MHTIIIVLGVLMLLTAQSYTGLLRSKTEAKLARSHAQRTQTFYNAEGCIAVGMRALRNATFTEEQATDPGWQETGTYYTHNCAFTIRHRKDDTGDIMWAGFSMPGAGDDDDDVPYSHKTITACNIMGNYRHTIIAGAKPVQGGGGVLWKRTYWNHK